MLHWLLELPWPLLLVLIVGAWVAGGTLGLSFVRALVLPRFKKSPHGNDAAAAIHHGILITYGLAAALIAIAVWEVYAEASKLVSAESTAIASLYRDAAGYPEPTRTELRAAIKAYTEQIIHDAWPLQRAGKTPTAGVELMDRVQDTLLPFNPSSPAEAAIHAETLRAYNGLVQARRLRLDAIHAGLPAAMWAVVLLGGIITLVASYFLVVEDAAIHRIMIALLSSLLGLLVFLIVHYDYPFRGSNSVSPEAYELVHDHLMK